MLLRVCGSRRQGTTWWVKEFAARGVLLVCALGDSKGDLRECERSSELGDDFH